MSGVDWANVERALAEANPLRVQGRVTRAAGIVIEASLPRAAVGMACEILTTARRIPAEVVGFNGSTALLMPYGDTQGLCDGSPVVPRSQGAELQVGAALLGRVVNAELRPVDGGPVPVLPDRAPLYPPPPAAMGRRRIERAFQLGVRAIDGLITLGEGQRMAVMAGPGVGKSMLMGMTARHSNADVIVAGLVGERGREVREFVERDLGEGLARTVVVVATADEAPLVRVRAALAATAVAEYFRERGRRVLLLLDSLTRVAMAQREVGLAAGEPPTSKGYPPSVFTLLPRLVERAGNSDSPGSMTALYTVLAEGDDLSDPVADAARAALDGHLVLSRRLAEAGHFPAVDVLQSVSRVMLDVVDARHRELAREVRELLSVHRDAQDLIQMGAYLPGSQPKVDRALATYEGLQRFLRQLPEEATSLAESVKRLEQLVRAPEVRRA